MADIFSKNKRSEMMSKVRSKDSKIEIEFRKKLWKVGLHYRKNSFKYFGKPDLVLLKYKTVIFIDSCFWHGCKRHGTTPQIRKKFWKQKLTRNVERDREVTRYYRKRDWKVFRVWEHQLKNDQKVIDRIIRKIQS